MYRWIIFRKLFFFTIIPKNLILFFCTIEFDDSICRETLEALLWLKWCFENCFLFIRNDKSFKTCFVYFATLRKQLTRIKWFQKKTKDWFENFSITANFLSFYKQHQTTIVTLFYPKSPWKVRSADRVVTFCSPLLVSTVFMELTSLLSSLIKLQW